MWPDNRFLIYRSHDTFISGNWISFGCDEDQKDEDSQHIKSAAVKIKNSEMLQGPKAVLASHSFSPLFHIVHGASVKVNWRRI